MPNKKKSDGYLIGLENLKCRCRLGVTPGERRHTRIIYLNIAVKVNSFRAVQSDSLADTMDYSLLAKTARYEATRKPWHTIESLAGNILKSIQKIPAIQGAKIKIRKPNPPGMEKGTTAVVEMGENFSF